MEQGTGDDGVWTQGGRYRHRKACGRVGYEWAVWGRGWEAGGERNAQAGHIACLPMDLHATSTSYSLLRQASTPSAPVPPPRRPALHASLSRCPTRPCTWTLPLVLQSAPLHPVLPYRSSPPALQVEEMLFVYSQTVAPNIRNDTFTINSRQAADHQVGTAGRGEVASTDGEWVVRYCSGRG